MRENKDQKKFIFGHFSYTEIFLVRIRSAYSVQIRDKRTTKISLFGYFSLSAYFIKCITRQLSAHDTFHIVRAFQTCAKISPIHNSWYWNLIEIVSFVKFIAWEFSFLESPTAKLCVLIWRCFYCLKTRYENLRGTQSFKSLPKNTFTEYLRTSACKNGVMIMHDYVFKQSLRILYIDISCFNIYLILPTIYMNFYF